MALLNFAIWYWNTFLNKCGYVIHHFNAYLSLYFFFANDITCCLFYIYFRLWKSLDKKQVKTIFLFEFKISHKAVETTHNINNAFGLGTANERTVQWWFKKFYKGDKSLEGEERSGQPSEVDNDQLRGSSKLILLKLHKKLPRTSMSTILY